ncbi:MULTISPECIES: hypothetical protein [Streptomyces]|uniref:Uncharacterized protein n=1 Tax=Streptomyces doebereineriae TaxID=3075528 RepID=A0ABU2VMA6_9ACTN|nr:hypothetical protein [Streptomyces sp. DSM 41640]MDT0486739.1 hypothetical protein [Streptomyces sp. DSM 41640]
MTLVAAGAKSELYLLDGYRHGFINAARRGDLAADALLDGGRLAGQGTAAARHYRDATGHGVQAEFGFGDMASFFAGHLPVPHQRT